MNLSLRALVISVLLSFPIAVFAQTPDFTLNSTIQTGEPVENCMDRTPYLEVDLFINQQDQGRPGLIYAAVVDKARTKAFFYHNNSWVSWEGGGAYPIMYVMRNGLFKTKLLLMVSGNLPSDGELYVGYGALSIKDEKLVENSMLGVAKVKEKYPDRKIAAVDADTFKRALIEQDLTKNSKYRFVKTNLGSISSKCHGSQG